MKLAVNGVEVDVDDRHAKTPLLWVLRDVLGMRGTKFGCGAGFCAACTVLIDGRNMKSCQTVAERAVGKAVTTVEGASGPVVDAIRDAWHRGNVVQCGYCQPGQTLAAVSLLTSKPAPDDAAIDTWMSGNLCRCGTYPRIRAAVHEAARMVAAGDDPPPLVAAPELEPGRLTPEYASDPVLPYIRFRDDGTLVAYSSQIEMGQGIHTGLATIVAEELDADFESVRVVNAANGGGPPRDVYGNPDLGGVFQLTGGSNSTRDSGFATASWRHRQEPGLRPQRRSCGRCPPERWSSSGVSCATRAAGRPGSRNWPLARRSCPFPMVSSPRTQPTTRSSEPRDGCASIPCRRSSERSGSRST